MVSLQTLEDFAVRVVRQGLPGGGNPAIDPDEPLEEGPIIGFVTEQLGIENPTKDEAENALREARQKGEITETELRQITRNMSVTYEDWISIAFETAKEKGADFSTTQKDIQEGKAPTSDAIKVFADIWQDRKDEMTSVEAAERIAESEISA